MALRWDFKTDKLGWIDIPESEAETKATVHLYDGNALMIAVYETEKHYYMHSFFADEEHAKNCLKDDPIYPKDYVFHLYRQRKANKLARILTKYQYSIIWEDMPERESTEQKKGD